MLADRRLVIVLFLVLSCLSSLGFAATRMVNATATGCVTADAYNDTIAAAVTATSTGDTVIICNGTYQENNININSKTLFINGESSTSVFMVVNSSNYAFTNPAASTIANITFHNSTSTNGIISVGAGTNFYDCIINYSARGLIFSGSNSNVRNVVIQNAQAGIWGLTVNGGTSTNVTVTNVTIDCTGSASSRGIRFQSGTIQHSVFTGMRINACPYNVFINTAGSASSNVTIKNSNITNSSTNAIFYNTNADGLLFINNTIDTPYGTAVVLRGNGTRILGNTFFNATTGIQFTFSNDTEISGNRFYNLTTSITITPVASSANISISNNTFENVSTGISIVYPTPAGYLMNLSNNSFLNVSTGMSMTNLTSFDIWGNKINNATYSSTAIAMSVSSSYNGTVRENLMNRSSFRAFSIATNSDNITLSGNQQLYNGSFIDSTCSNISFINNSFFGVGLLNTALDLRAYNFTVENNSFYNWSMDIDFSSGSANGTVYNNSFLDGNVPINAQLTTFKTTSLNLSNNTFNNPGNGISLTNLSGFTIFGNQINNATSLTSKSIVLTDCANATISKNFLNLTGFLLIGIYNVSTNITITSNIFWYNKSLLDPNTIGIYFYNNTFNGSDRTQVGLYMGGRDHILINNTFSKFLQAMYFSYGANITVNSSKFFGNYYGAFVSLGAVTYSNITFDLNNFSINDYGMLINNGMNTRVLNNAFDRNNISISGSSSTFMNDSLIYANNFTNCSAMCIFSTSTKNLTISHNNFWDANSTAIEFYNPVYASNISDNNFYRPWSAAGYFSVDNTSIENNLIENSSNIGVSLQMSGYSNFTNNTIVRSGKHGIFADQYTSSTTYIKLNNVSNSSDVGIYIGYGASPNVTNNSIYNNSIGVVTYLDGYLSNNTFYNNTKFDAYYNSTIFYSFGTVLNFNSTFITSKLSVQYPNGSHQSIGMTTGNASFTIPSNGIYFFNGSYTDLYGNNFTKIKAYSATSTKNYTSSFYFRSGSSTTLGENPPHDYMYLNKWGYNPGNGHDRGFFRSTAPTVDERGDCSNTVVWYLEDAVWSMKNPSLLNNLSIYGNVNTSTSFLVYITNWASLSNNTFPAPSGFTPYSVQLNYSSSPFTFRQVYDWYDHLHYQEYISSAVDIQHYINASNPSMMNISYGAYVFSLNYSGSANVSVYNEDNLSVLNITSATTYTLPIDHNYSFVINGTHFTLTGFDSNSTSGGMITAYLYLDMDTNISVKDTNYPAVYLQSPVNGTNSTSQTVNFFFNFTHSWATNASCAVYLNEQNIGSNASVINNTSTNISSGALGEGFDYWYVNCTDPDGNKNQSEIRNITIDAHAPYFNSTYTPADGQVSTITSQPFTFMVFDGVSSSMACNLIIDGSSYASNSSVSNATLTTMTATVSLGTHYWNITCNDSLGNSNTTTTRSFYVSSPISSGPTSFSDATKKYDVSLSKSFDCSSGLLELSASSSGNPAEGITLMLFNLNDYGYVSKITGSNGVATFQITKDGPYSADSVSTSKYLGTSIGPFDLSLCKETGKEVGTAPHSNLSLENLTLPNPEVTNISVPESNVTNESISSPLAIQAQAKIDEVLGKLKTTQVGEAQVLIKYAQKAFSEGKYKESLELADKADTAIKNALAAAKAESAKSLPTTPQPAQKQDYSLLLLVAAIIVIAALASFFLFKTPKKR